MKLLRLDHVVIYAVDVPRTIDFYTTVLGMTHIVFDDDYHALQFGDQKINIHDSAAPFRPHAQHPASGAFDVCLLTDTPTPDVLAHLRAHDVTVVDGLCQQTGSLGPMESVYIHDPDGNLIEIANYSFGHI